MSGPYYRTRTGRVLNDDDIEALAAEAERGYDVEHLRKRRPLSTDAPWLQKHRCFGCNSILSVDGIARSPQWGRVWCGTKKCWVKIAWAVWKERMSA